LALLNHWRFGELKFNPDSAANRDAVAEDLGSRGLSSQ
jgi:hypothetical protein